MGKRILIATGGSGGHIFPAIGFASDLTDHDVVFAGGGLETNRFFDQERYPFHTVTSATFGFKNPLKMAMGLLKLYRGTKESLSLLHKIKPDLVVGFGSFHTLPLLLAARWTKTPFVLSEADAYPGRVNRLMAPFSRFVAVQFPEAAKHIKGKTQVCPLPLREGFKKGPLPKEGARLSLGLDPCKKTVLVFGGSQGAKSLNDIVAKEISQVHRELDIQLIHLTGYKDNEKLAAHYKNIGLKALVLPFSSEMPLLWSASDLCIARAGASTIGEMIAFTVPGILIPYPFAMNNHQEKNGEIISKKIGGAAMLKESELEGHLVRLLKHILGNRQEVCHAMRCALGNTKMRQGPSLVELIEEEL